MTTEQIMTTPRFDAAIEGIREQGWFIGEGFWPAEDLPKLVEECRALWHEGGFKRAGVGRGEGHVEDDRVRGDHIRWLDRAGATPAIAAYLDALEAYRQRLNENFFLGLFDFECMAAVYTPGAFYGRHLDRFRDDDARTVTAILYLNADWQPGDGGELRFYPGDGSTVDVPPKAGTFVSFLSSDYWHEVLPAKAERLTLTGWFRRRGQSL